jgi:hypothetical protein
MERLMNITNEVNGELQCDIQCERRTTGDELRCEVLDRTIQDDNPCSSERFCTPSLISSPLCVSTYLRSLSPEVVVFSTDLWWSAMLCETELRAE